MNFDHEHSTNAGSLFLCRLHARGKAYSFEMLSLFTCLLYVLDVHADCFFTVNLMFAYRDSGDAVLLTLCIVSVLFLLLSRIISLRELERFIAKYIDEPESSQTGNASISSFRSLQSEESREYFGDYDGQLSRHDAALQLEAVQCRAFCAVH